MRCPSVAERRGIVPVPPVRLLAGPNGRSGSLGSPCTRDAAMPHMLRQLRWQAIRPILGLPRSRVPGFVCSNSSVRPLFVGLQTSTNLGRVRGIFRCVNGDSSNGLRLALIGHYVAGTAWPGFFIQSGLAAHRIPKNGGGGGSRTPVRKALRPEAYMLIAFDLVRQPRLERARRAAG